jgi:aminopeptidase-like protein
MRSKYGEYPEYHTSLDDLSLVTPDGLHGGFVAIQSAIKMLEANAVFKTRAPCEPQLGKRGLYPNTSVKSSGNSVRDQMNVLSYCDGINDLISIAELCKIEFAATLEIINRLAAANVIEIA